MQETEKLKKRLIENTKDRVYSFVMDEGNFRGAVIHSTRLVKDLKERHSLGIIETLILGHACSGTELMATTLKGNNRLKFHIQCSGPVKGLVCEANSFGDVRGYLFQNPIPIKEAPKDFRTSPYFNAGFMTITYFKENSKSPYSGKVMLEYGEIAQEIANYYLTSEQIPSACNLSVTFSPDGEVTGAGGILIQKMPGTDDITLEKLENSFLSLPSIGEEFSKGYSPEDIIYGSFKEFNPKILDNKRVAFSCSCEKERMLAYIKGLGKQTLKEILNDNNFPLEVVCHYCSNNFLYDKNIIQQAYNEAR
ncbi:MAG: Hsp33 family molecular chaperone HslO [Desulforegulaceae bacterium]|nr:Hsp33 family molecular chaperone HslO [Desulforegulaceae bacterium]